MRLSSLLIALALIACDGPAAPADASSPKDASEPTPDAGHDAGSIADAGQDAGEPLPELPAPWRRETSYPEGVDHHVTTIIETPAGAYLYVIGGMRVTGNVFDLYDDVRRARIGDDGVLGPWEDETPLGGPLAFQSIATSGRTIILGSGASLHDTGELGWLGSVRWSTLDDEGHLTDWYGESDVFDAPMLHGSATVLGDRVYFVGGGGGTVAFQPSVVSMRIGAERLDDRRDETPMTGGRSHHVSVAREGALYVLGGFTDPATPSPTPATEVLRAVVDPTTGMVGAWESAGTIAEPQWTAAHVELTDALILVGGGVGDVPTARVVRYPLDAEGVGEPELLSPLPYPRAHVHQTPVYGGRIYSVGGRYAKGLGQASSTDVYSAALDEL